MPLSNVEMTRRTLLGAGLGLSALALAGCNRFGIGSSAADTASLNVIWWGDSVRAERTEKMLDLFRAAHEGLTIKTEFQDSGPYADKMATRFAAGDVPDLFNQRPDTIREYIERGALLDLGDHLDVLDLTDTADTVPFARAGDGLYGVPAALNAVGFILDVEEIERLGVGVPDGDTWSWDDLWAFSREVSSATGADVFGVDLSFGTMQNLAVFVRQHGEEYFAPDGTFGASEATLEEWFAMSVAQRQKGALPPAGRIETTGNSPAQSALVAGLVTGLDVATNNLAAFAELLDGGVELLRFPGETQGVRRGHVVTPSMYWSIGTESPNRDLALELLDFIVNDIEGNLATGTTRGVPIASKPAAAVYDTLGEADRASIDYITALSQEDLPTYILDPSGAQQIADVLAEVDVEVAFERISPLDAARRIREEADARVGLSA